jgi:uncharacterized surface protein with fasciclin (FAS1) repeats
MQTVEDILQGKEQSVTCHALDTLIKAAGLEYTLQGRRPITLFAPSDLAFSQLQDCSVYDMLKDITKLQQLLQFHIVPLVLTTTDLIAMLKKPANPGQRQTENQGKPEDIQVPTLSGAILNVRITPDFQVEGTRVFEADIAADNGVVHIINSLLWPAGLAPSSFSTKKSVYAQEDEACN